MPKCSYCDKPAKYNLQRNWSLFSITEDEEYTRQKEWNDDTNDFACQEHYDDGTLYNS